MKKILDVEVIVAELNAYLSALNGELQKFFQANNLQVDFGWDYAMEDSPKGLLIREEKENIDYDILKRVVLGFNTFYSQWHSKYGCEANFLWVKKDGWHKTLEVTTIDFPVFRREVESDQLSKVLKSETMKSILGGEHNENRNDGGGAQEI